MGCCKLYTNIKIIHRTLFILSLVFFSVICRSQIYNGELIDYLINRYDTISQKNDVILIRNIDDLYHYMIKQEKTFKMTNIWGNKGKIYENGIKTALNNSKISKFYVAYSIRSGKPYDFIPIPSLDTSSYNKLNEIIKKCDLENHNHRLIRSMCFQLMDCLLYFDYFGVDFLCGDIHDIIKRIEVDHLTLFYQFTDINGSIRKILDYKDNIPLIKMVNKYIYYQ